jgi:hypothetical protein
VCFRVVDPLFLFDDDYRFERLEADPDLHVTRHTLRRFEPLVVRFLMNGKPRQGSSETTSLPNKSRTGDRKNPGQSLADRLYRFATKQPSEPRRIE